MVFVREALTLKNKIRTCEANQPAKSQEYCPKQTEHEARNEAVKRVDLFRSTSIRVSKGNKDVTHQPANPYNLVVFDRFRNLNAESPSKKDVSGITPPPASRLNHPLPGAIFKTECLVLVNVVTRLCIGR